MFSGILLLREEMMDYFLSTIKHIIPFLYYYMLNVCVLYPHVYLKYLFQFLYISHITQLIIFFSIIITIAWDSHQKTSVKMFAHLIFLELFVLTFWVNTFNGFYICFVLKRNYKTLFSILFTSHT